MKRILCSLLVAATVASCCKVDNSMYFDNSNKRVVEDATAEFDTLSYAVGMNFGLSLKFQSRGLTLNEEILLATLEDELSKESLDYDLLDENKELMNRFGKERLQPYTMAQFRKSIAKQSDAVAEEVSLFDDEFTQERVSEMFGHDIAGVIVNAAYPLNMYWFRAAMHECFAIKSEVLTDSLLRLNMMQMREGLKEYHMNQLPEYNAEASRKWLERISEQRGVNAMVVEGDTLYFRVDVAGNTVKPKGMNDTISISYDLYTRNGKLIESHAKREQALTKALEEAKAAVVDTAKVKDMNAMMRVTQLTQKLKNLQNMRMPVSKSLLKGMQYAVQNVGEGGTITAWMPSSLAYGERGNKAVSPNEAVVMVITLKEVSYGPTD
ncbi:MAG: FKBP-type peptidyl-prolyl cis-trans isomerase, partial [Alistipes sp.]|nr:FKBP-type peptidyl-prolyl cis-trans isomerase [Alistipes sp.]